MINPCNFLAPDGSKSELGQHLVESYGPERALSVWSTLHSQDIYSIHDWRTDQSLNTEQGELKPEAAAELMSRLGMTLQDNMNAPGQGPQIPEKVLDVKIKPKDAQLLVDGKNNMFTRGSAMGMAQGERAQVILNSRVMIATYDGTIDEAGKIHKFTVSNPYSISDITSELGLTKDTVVGGLAANSSQLQASLGRMFAQIKGPDGAPIEGKYFTPEQQTDAVDAVLTDLYEYLRGSLKNGDNLTAGTLLAGLKITRAKIAAFNNGLNVIASGQYVDSPAFAGISQEEAQRRMGETTNVLRSYEQIAGFALERLKAYGFNVNEKIRENITDYLNKVAEMTDDLGNLDESQANAEITGEEGRGLKDWTDSPFELNPRDTASKRMKFFLATIKDSEFGTEEAPRKLRMVFGDEQINKDILAGRKVYTVRTPEQVSRIKLKDGRGSVTIGEKTFVVEEEAALNSAEDLEDWADVFAEEKVDALPGSVVYKLTPFVAKENVLVNKRSPLGFPRLAPFEQVFTDILSRVQEAPVLSYQSFVNTLQNSGSPTMMRVAQELQNSDQQLRNEFFKVMSKQYYRMRVVLFNSQQNGGEMTVEGSTINANRFNEVDTLVNNWRENQKSAENGVITNQGGRLGVNQEKAQTFLTKFKQVAAYDWAKAPQSAIDSLESWTGEFLSAIGINMSPEALRDFRMNTQKITKGTQFEGSWFKQYSLTADGKPNGVISALMMRLAGLGDVESQVEDMDVELQIGDTAVEDFLKNNNPLYTENTALRILAKTQAKFSGALFAPMHKSAEGKSIYAYGLHTYQSHAFNQLRTSEDFRNQYKSIPFAKRSWLLEKLGSAEQREKIELNYLDAIKAAYKKGGGTVRTEMSPREQELSAILAFQNRGNKYANFFDLTKSDKSTTPMFVNVEKTVVKSLTLSPEMTQHFVNVFESEFDRIRHWEDNKGSINNKNFVNGGGLFYLMPQFNFENMFNELMVEGTITHEQFGAIWNSDGTLARTEDVVTRNEIVTEYIRDFTREMASATRERWRDMGIFDAERMWFDQSWVKKARRNLGIITTVDEKTGEPGLLKVVGNDVAPISRERANELVASLAALEYSTNYFLMNTSTSQLISGDPALAYKGKKGMTQMQQVDATMKEYQKRLAKDIGPGADPSWDRKSTYRALTIQDPLFRSYLGEIIPAYEEFDTAADAQEVTTVQEDLDVRYAQGLIPDSVYHEMSAIIKPGEYYEFTKPEHLAIILQPVKPVYVGADFQNGLMDIHYIKTSSYAMLPQMTAGKEIDKLRIMMEGGGIQRAAFASGKKMSQPVKSANLFDSEGKFQFDVDVDSAVQTLQRGGMRIQQEVPYDEEKEKILTVSQMNKNIVEGIQKIPDFAVPAYAVDGTVGESTMSGAELRAYKEDIRKQMFDLQRHELLRSIGAQSTADGYEFVDKPKLLRRLEEEAISRGYPPNDLDAIRTRLADGKLVLPLFMNGSADRFESLLMAMIKGVVKLKMPGKSFVQASSLGYRNVLTDENLDKGSIVYSEDYDYMQNLKSLHKDENGKVKAAQVLVPFNFFGKDGKALKIEDFTKVNEQGRTVIDTEKLPAELRRMVGARIPNQSHSSMLPIEIVGFIPKQMGDTMIVPAEITQQMGSDFDVDKLYIYKPGYKFADSKLKAQDMAHHADEGMDMKQLQQQYFDVHWSVLTHPQMYEKVLAPLDKPELKNEKVLAEARAAGGFKNYFDVSSQLTDFMSQKDAKSLVGSTALTNSFNALIQDKNLYLAHLEFVDTGGEADIQEVEDFITVADEATGNPIRLHRISGTGVARYYEEENPGEYAPYVERTKSSNIESQLSEVVDHAKNRTIDFLNINQFTYPASAAMSILESKDGQAISLKYNSRLLQQEVIREFADRMAKGNDSMSTEYIQDLKSKIFSDLIREYAARAGGEEGIKDRIAPMFSPQILEAQLNTPQEQREDPEYAFYQYHALQLFMQFDKVGDTLRSIQSKFSQDTRGAGSDLLASLNLQNDLQKTMSNGVISGVETIAGTLDKYGKMQPTTEIGWAYKNTTELANDLYPEILPYKKLTNLYQSISEQMGRDRLTNDHQRRIADAVRSFLFADKRNGLYEDSSRERARLLYDSEAGPSLAKRVAQAQAAWGSGNYFLKRLATHIGISTEEASTITYNATGASSLDDFEVVKAWAGLLTSANEEERSLAEDLVRYTYASGGMQTAQNFAKFVPVGYLAGLEMAKELNTRIEELDSEMSAKEIPMRQQLFQHNPDMAMQMKADFSQTLEHAESEPNVIPENFSLRNDILERHEASSLLVSMRTDMGPVLKYPEYLSVRKGNQYLLYRNMGETMDDTTNFQRIDTLGKGDILEYDADRSYVRSVFPGNRALMPLEDVTEEEFQPFDYSRKVALASDVRDILGITDEGTPLREVVSKTLATSDLDIDQGTKLILQELFQIADKTSKIVGRQELPKVRTTTESGVYGFFNYDVTQSADGKVGYKGSVIALNFERLQRADNAARTLAHEMAHYTSSLTITGYQQFLDGKINKPDWLTPQVEAALKNIDLLRQRAVKFFEGNAAGDEELQYALTNNKEFVSAVFENKALQSLLNSRKSIQGTNKSLLRTIIDGLREMLTAVSQYLGIDVREGYMLEEAIKHSMVIMGVETSTADNTPGTGEQTDLFSGRDEKAYFGEAYLGADEAENALTPEMEKAVQSLEILKKRLEAKHVRPSGNKMTKTKGREFLLRGAEINSLEYDISKIRMQGTLANVVGVGIRQMKMIGQMMTEENLSKEQLENLLDTANTWEQVIDNLYADVTDELPKEAIELRGQAAAFKAKVTNKVIDSELNNPGGVIKSLAAFQADAMSVNTFRAHGMDLSRVSSQVAQQIDNYLKDSVRIEKEESRRLRAELSEYQAKMNAYAKANGKSTQQVYDMLMQGGKNWGLVSIVSPEYYEFKGSTYRSLMNKLQAADAIADPSIRKELIKSAYATYRDTIAKNIMYVDTSLLFDDKGELVDGPTAAAHKAKLVAELGEDLAGDLIAQAKTKYNEFLIDRFEYKEAIRIQVVRALADYQEEVDADGTLSADERAESVATYKQELTEEFNHKFNEWEGNHNPDVFFRSLRGELRGNPKFSNFTAIVDAPRPSAEDGKFYDKRFARIQDDAPLRELYEFIQNKMAEFKGHLPAHVVNDLYDNFLPIVEKETKLGLKPEQLKAAGKELLRDAISMDAGAAEYTKMNSGMVPIRYTNPGSVQIEDRERDVLRLLERFGAMAQHYKRATEVQSGVELLHRIMVEKIEDSKGGMFDRINNGTKNLSDMVTYAKDRLLYQKGRLAEGDLGSLYSLNPIKQRKMEQEMVKIKDDIDALDNKYAEGGIELETYNEEKKLLMDKQAGMPQSRILASKLGDTTIKLTELKALAYNPFSAFANLSFGVVSVMIHANGQLDFNKSQAYEAFTTMLHATGRALSFGKVDTKTAQKILNLMEKYDVMGDLLDSDYAGASRIQNKRGVASKLISPYQIMRNSDYFMKGMILVALMKNEKVGDGTLWDAYDSEGNWLHGDDKAWVSENAEDETEFRRFQAKAIQVSKTIMGNQDAASTMMIKKTVLGRLVSQFRASWLSEGFDNRFGDERFDSQLGRTTKGRYRTIQDLGVIGTIRTLMRQAMSVVLSVDPFTGRKRNGEAMSPVDIENMRKNFAEIASYLTVLAAVVALKFKLDDDDDDSPEAKRNRAIGQTLLNLIIRNQQDITYYASPGLFTGLSSSVIPSMKVYVDFQRAISGTVTYLGTNSEDVTGRSLTGEKVMTKWLRALPYGSAVTKFSTMAQKNLNN